VIRWLDVRLRDFWATRLSGLLAHHTLSIIIILNEEMAKNL
jgi:hypothetical protein